LKKFPAAAGNFFMQQRAQTGFLPDAAALTKNVRHCAASLNHLPGWPDCSASSWFTYFLF
jgi:hypothetical protein